MAAKGSAMKLSATVAVLLLTTTSLTMAQPQTASLRSGQDKLPAPQLEDGKVPGAFPLLDCLNSLVQGDTARTEKSCSAALLQNPQEHTAYKLRGYAYLIDHRFERASADFQAALRLKPHDHEDLAGYAQSLSGQGRFQEAVVQYRKALDVAPARAPYWNGLCWARAGTGQHLDQALKECNRALSLQPGAAGALNSRGLVHLRLKQFDRSVADYSASLAVGPLQASARFGRGLAWLYSGKTEKGKVDITEARRRDPEIDSLFGLLGILRVSCIQQQQDCPKGFPARPNKPAPTHLVAQSGQ
jgi:tetratricopeptide (TPR) repeat protein